MYTNAVDQVRGMRQPIEIPFRLAKVTSLSNGRAYVQFYGESSASTKLYPYIEGYKPTVGDDVLLVVQGETFIIMGKLSKDNITDNYFLLKSAADALYLTEAAADEKYEPKGSGYPTQLRNSKFWFGFNSANDAEVLSFRLDGTTTSPTHVSLGNSANPFTMLYVNGIDLRSSGAIIPYVKDASDIGSTSKMFRYGYFNYLGDNSLSYSIQNLNARNVKLFGNVTPYQNNTINIGSSSSSQFNNVYAKQFYQNGTAISTSDKRKKKSIKDLAKQYIEFFKNLRPRTFKFKDGESDRTHTGFIAQEVEEVAGAAGIDNKDLAFLCIDKDGSYGLRYEELIAVQTAVIQDLLKRVEVLEIKVNGRSES